jgi:diguanylate cyclase (GGDEF)-like protein
MKAISTSLSSRSPGSPKIDLAPPGQARPEGPGGSLTGQLARRVALVILIVGALFAALTWVLWNYEQRTLQQQQGETQRAAARERLNEILRGWQRDVETLAASLAFQRMLASPGEARWTRLHAYLVTLSDTLPHSGLLVLDANRRVTFALGQEAREFTPGGLFIVESDWYRSADHRQLHRVLRAPLWLGLDGGRGTLVMLRPLDNSLMRQLASKDVNTHLTVDDVVYASSLGNRLVGRAAHYPDQPAHRSDAGNLCVDLSAAGLGDRLHVELLNTPGVSPWLFVGAGVTLGITLLGALYLAVGVWTRRVLARIRALGQAAHGFDTSHRVDAPVEAALAESGAQRDEIGTLKQALHGLMQGAQAREAESRAYLKTLDMLEEAVVEVDRDLRVLRASSALSLLTGVEGIGRYFPDGFHAEDREMLATQLEQIFSGASTQLNLRLRAMRGGGNMGEKVNLDSRVNLDIKVNLDSKVETWLEARFVPADQPATVVRGVLRDITQTYLQEKHIAHIALHDALTGLPNRVLLDDRCKIAIRQADRLGHGVGLGFIDLDHFKQINDSLGHKAGDKMLIAFARRVREALRGGDTLCRWGGDEFVVLLPDIPDLATLREVAAKIAGVCRDPLHIDENEYAITFSMGFAVYPDDADNVDTLLSQADRAMFHAKSQGRNNAQFFSDLSMKGPDKKDLYIQNKLAQAIRDGRIQTFYQPVVEAGSRRIVAVEALARWHDEELGWTPPSRFIPMAENLGLVRELGDQVWQAALVQLGRWKRRGIRMAVNISNRQLFMPYFTEKLIEDVQHHGLAPGDLILEVTESVALLDVEYAAERLKELSDAGFHIAVDDFGTGYSSLSQLHAMPVDELKIDIAFVRRIHEPTGRRLIQAIVHMAEALDLSCVAEGVEDEAAAAALEQIGVHRMQGYLFAKPMPATEVEVLWEARGEGPGG